MTDTDIISINVYSSQNVMFTPKKSFFNQNNLTFNSQNNISVRTSRRSSPNKQTLFNNKILGSNQSSSYKVSKISKIRNKNLQETKQFQKKYPSISKYEKFFQQNSLKNNQTLNSLSKCLNYLPKKNNSQSRVLNNHKNSHKNHFSLQVSPAKSLKSKRTELSLSRRNTTELLVKAKQALGQFKQRQQQFLNQIIKYRSVIQLEKRKRLSKNLDMSRVLKLKKTASPSKQKKFRKISQQNFVILKKIGQGTFAQVFLAIQKYTGFLVTLKKIDRSKLISQKRIQQLIREIKIQSFLCHPNILKLYGFFVSRITITLILEYMQQGTIYSRLQKSPFCESQASKTTNQLLYALDYIHSHNIVHRDIKPENIVVSYGVNKLCDFGTSVVCSDRRNTICGTLDYSSPELVAGQTYGFKLDLWSVGVLCFEILAGKPPFYHISKRDTIKHIAQFKNGQLKYPKHFSLLAISFIANFLQKNPDQRIQIKKALTHKFITKFMDQQTQQLRQLYCNSSLNINH